MDEKRLLELAARAAGIGPLWYCKGSDVAYYGEIPHHRTFKPLTDDGDAFRLAVALRFRVECDNNGQAYVWKDGVLLWNEFALHVDVEAERRAATRRAITRAAAAIAQERGGNDQHNAPPSGGRS